MKLLYILISLIFLIVLVKGDCMKCFQDDQKCSYTDLDGILRTGSCEGDGFVCGPYKNETKKENYVCRPFAQLNEACFENDDTEFGICLIGLVCQKGICVNAKFSTVGDSCEQQSDCYSKFATCTNKICTNPTNECKYEEDCLFSQYCQDKVCTARIQRGQDCPLNKNEEACVQPLVCQNTKGDEEIGTCQNLFQNEIGSACNNDEDCNSEKSLYCNNGICQEYVEPVQKGNCTTDEDVCDRYHRCGCDGECVGQFTPLTQKDNLLPLVECLNENKCRLSGNIYSSSSCASKYCGPQLCKYLEASYGVLDDVVCPSIKSVVKEYCNTNDSSKISYSLFSLLLILIISLLF
ncbi:hypothetical protein ACTFIV_009765 [Dictyostelium citrinum]